MKNLIIKFGGRSMNIYRLILAFIILTSVCNAQLESYKFSEKFIEKKIITDTAIIKSIIYKIITS